MKTSDKFDDNGCNPLNLYMIQFWYSWRCNFVSKPIKISSTGKTCCYQNMSPFSLEMLRLNFCHFCRIFHLSVDQIPCNSEETTQGIVVKLVGYINRGTVPTWMVICCWIIIISIISCFFFWFFLSVSEQTLQLIQPEILYRETSSSIYSSISLYIYEALWGASGWDNMNRHSWASSRMRVKQLAALRKWTGTKLRLLAFSCGFSIFTRSLVL